MKSSILGRALACLVGALMMSPIATAQSWDPSDIPVRAAWVPNGPAPVLTEIEGALYCGGRFTHVGRPTGPIAVFDKAGGDVETAYPLVRGRVLAIESDGVGGLFIGGAFQHVGGVARANLAHIRADGTISGFDPGVFGEVRDLYLVGTTLYIGGSFSEVASITRKSLAAVDSGSGALLPWDPAVGAQFLHTQGGISKLMSVGTEIFVGGDFVDSIGGAVRMNAALVDAVTGVATLFRPDPDGPVHDAAVHVSGVVLGGDFTVVGGAPRSNLAIVNVGDGASGSFDVPVDQSVQSITMIGDTLYVAGFFDMVGAATRSDLAAIDVSNASILPWAPTILPTSGGNAAVASLEASGAEVWIGGTFFGLNGADRYNVAAVDAVTGALIQNLADVLGEESEHVAEVRVFGNQIAVGGRMTIAEVEERLSAFAFELATGDLLPWAPRFGLLSFPESPDSVTDIIDAGSNHVFVAGAFGVVDGVTHPRLARVHAVTGVLDPFFNAGYAINASAPDPLMLAGGHLYTGLNGTASVPGIGRHDPTTGQFLGGMFTNQRINDYALSADESTLYVGGRFTEVEIPGPSYPKRNHLLAIDAISSSLLPWNPDADKDVEALSVVGGSVFVAGEFQKVGGQIRQYVAEIDGRTDAPLPFDPSVGGAGSTAASSIVGNGAQVFIAGDFTTIGGVYAPGASILHRSNAQAIPWSVEGGSVDALELSDGRLYVSTGVAGFLASATPRIASFDVLSFFGDQDVISLSAGGTQVMSVDAGAQLAGKSYWVLGSILGTHPGTTLIPGLEMPLSGGPYMQYLLSAVPSPLIPQGLGVLDSEGRASFSLALPPSTFPGAVGLSLYHACLLFDLQTETAVAVTNPIGVRLGF